MSEESMIERVSRQLSYDCRQAAKAGDRALALKLAEAANLFDPLVEARTFQEAYDAVLAIAAARSTALT